MGLLDMLFGGDGQPQQNSLPMDELRQLGLSDGLINYYQQEQAKAQKAQMWNNTINGIANITSSAQGMGARFGGGGGDGGGSSGPGANSPLGLDGLVDRALKFSQLRDNIQKREQAAAQRAAIPELAKALGIDLKTAAALVDRLPSMYEDDLKAKRAARADVDKGNAVLDAAGITDQKARQDYYAGPILQDQAARAAMPALAQNLNVDPALAPALTGQLPGMFKDRRQGEISANANVDQIRAAARAAGITDEAEIQGLIRSSIQPKAGAVFGGEKTGYYTLDPKTGKANQVVSPQQSLGVSEDVLKAETGLRGEYTQQAKDYGNRQTSFMTMEDLAKQGEGASDIALVLSLMKVYDPTSTVTGSEAANASNAGGVPAAIRAKYNQLVGGGKLDQQTRDELVNAARLRFDQELDNHGKTIDYFRGLAKQYRVDPDRVVQDVRDPRLMDERFSRQIPTFAPEAIMNMSQDQLAKLEKHASKMTTQQLQAAAVRKRDLEGRR